MDMHKSETKSNLLDILIFERWHINLEVALYILLGIIAVVACFYNLGARTQSHDESLHTLYSWKLYAGDGYEHNPMMHGPFLFHINALFYFLFGVSDFTARMSAAVFGVILVLLPALLQWITAGRESPGEASEETGQRVDHGRDFPLRPHARGAVPVSSESSPRPSFPE